MNLVPHLSPEAARAGATVAVLGAGNGGLAVAGALALQGCRVRLWDRRQSRLQPVLDTGGIQLREALEGIGRPDVCTTDLGAALRGAEVVIVVTTADAHEPLFRQAAALLEPGQTVLLLPGRTGGALCVREVLRQVPRVPEVVVAEAQSLVYACRARGADVRIIGVKEYVPLAACPARDTAIATAALAPLFPCLRPVENVLLTSLENIGAIFHPGIVLFNAATIERAQPFYFYQDMTPRVARFLESLDHERLAVGTAFGVALTPIAEWICKAYPGTPGRTLCERMRSNPAYHEILAPGSLDTRLLTEDLPTGLVPLHALGAAAGVSMPLTRSLIDLGGALLRRDFWTEGRSLAAMGLEGLSPTGILEHLQ